MKYSLLSYTSLALVIVSSVTVTHAALESAEITRLYNDVRVRFASASEREAKIGDQITGQTMVRTGMKSRTEVKFNDATLSRLGANTVFSFERGTRNMEVGSGTLFLQVPKDAGGATIHTAAVTAAVTGTTIMIEIDANNVVKIIVLEGTLELSLNGDSRVKRTLRAGEMIVMEPNALTIPMSVDVDIDLLMKTSQLINEEEFDKLPPSAIAKIGEAIDEQQKRIGSGELTKTNLVIPGAGTRVILTDQNFERRLVAYLDNLRDPSARQTPQAPQNPQPKPGVTRPPLNNQIAEITRPILQSGIWNIDDSTKITTNPTITNGTRVAQGTIYLPSLAGAYTQWVFGEPDTASGGRLQFGLNESNAWSVYYLETIVVSGTPTVITSGPRQILFASPNAINFELPPSAGLDGGGSTVLALPQMDLGAMGLRSVGFTTQDAAINLNGLDIYGQTTDLGLFANGPGGDINIDAYISLGEGVFNAFAGGDLSTQPWTNINADIVELSGRGMVSIDATTINANAIFIDSGGSLKVENSSQLSLMTAAAGPGGMIGIRSKNGNVFLRGGSSIRADGPMQILDIEAANGDVLVDGEVFEGSEVNLSASSLVAFRASGANQPTISLNNAFVNSNGGIELLARGPGAKVLFGDSTFLTAQNIRIFSEGSGSLIRFTGNTQLNANQVSLAARRILVDSQAQVNINASTVGIFADQHDYNLNGNQESPFGNLNTGESTPTIGTYGQR